MSVRIVVLCKRQYMAKDLLDDYYGRLFELPVGLAALGHEVQVVATSYRLRAPVDRVERGVRWVGLNIWPWPLRVPCAIRRLTEEFQPDIVLASSDAPHLLLGARIAGRLAKPLVVDLYDDYEAFGLTRVLGLKSALRRTCAAAQSVVTISRTLSELVRARTHRLQGIHVIGNGVRDVFVPGARRREARVALGLPQDVPLIGTAGALSAQRGIGDLFDAFATVQDRHPSTRLVVAGPRDRFAECSLPSGTIDLGHLPHSRIGLLLRALDVGVVCNRPGPFAEACHPMKLVEMAACGLPTVAADIGEVSRLLADRPDARYPPGNSAALAARIMAMLETPRPLDARLARSWSDLSEQLSDVLAATAGEHRRAVRP